MNIKSNGKRSWSRQLLPALVACLAVPALADRLQLVSVPDPSQVPAGGAGDSWASIISADGRYVLFASTANNLAALSNGLPMPLLCPARVNVFLRDRTSQTTTLVSVNLAGTGGGNGDSFPAALSTNGQYALFESSASDLVIGDTNNVADVFRRDLVSGTTVLVGMATYLTRANGPSRGAVMTPDGRYVAFASDASTLVPGDTNGIADVFVRDLQAGTTTLVSVGARPSFTELGGSESPVITPDGRYVAFYSGATNLVAGLTNAGDIYVRDMVGGTTTWASSYARTAVQAALGAPDAFSCSHTLSDDGQYVAYQANPAQYGRATNGVVLRYNLGSSLTDVIHTNATWWPGAPEDIRTLDMTPDGRFVAFLANTNGPRAGGYSYPYYDTCVLVWDGQTATTTLASGDSDNSVPTNSSCVWPSITPDGRFVLFLRSVTNLVANAPTNGYHVYMRDLQGGTTTLVDTNSNGVGSINGPITIPQMTPDGRFVCFESPDASLVAGDRNRTSEVFARDLVAGAIELISARAPALSSVTPNGPSGLSAASLSADGRYLAFTSEADDLVLGDANGYRDVFLRDLLLGTNTLVSAATNGGAADGISTEAVISADGRYVAFTSSADNLVAGDNNSAMDVFIRDLQAGTTLLVSVDTSGTSSGNGASHLVAFSPDGRFVLFWSGARNLASGSFSGENLFLRDLQAGTSYALTYSGDGFIHSGLHPNVMTPDGRFVIFARGFPDAYPYIWDSLSASTWPVPIVSSVTALAISPDSRRYIYCGNGTLHVADRGASPDWNYSAYWTNWTFSTIGPAATTTHPGLNFSGDGRFLAYVAKGNVTNQVCLYDLQYGTNLLVSHRYDSSAEASGPSDWPEISSDGRFVAFRSAAPDLVPGDANGLPDIFLYDCRNNTTTLVSVNRFGTAAGGNRSLGPAFSPDGQTLFFQSWAPDLVAQDFNQASDLFVLGLHASGAIPVFSVSIVGGSQGPCLIWPVASGKSYRVQFKDSLADPNWHDLNCSVTILGNQGCLNDTTAGSSPRFYRVVAY